MQAEKLMLRFVRDFQYFIYDANIKDALNVICKISAPRCTPRRLRTVELIVGRIDFACINFVFNNHLLSNSFASKDQNHLEFLPPHRGILAFGEYWDAMQDCVR